MEGMGGRKGMGTWIGVKSKKIFVFFFKINKNKTK